LADRRSLQRRPSAATRPTSRGAGAGFRCAYSPLARNLRGSHLDRHQGKNAPRYTRYDYTAWGEPVRVNGFAADGRWVGDVPEAIGAADGAAAERMIPKIRAAVESYQWRAYGDYRAWPGPNSNTFVTAVLAAVPELRTTLPPTAIGKDFPYDGDVFGLTPSRTGIRVTIGGYIGLSAGWIEGIELNFLGAVFGFDLRRPALKLPGLGRLGFAP
jgi:hypothetical protein